MRIIRLLMGVQISNRTDNYRQFSSRKRSKSEMEARDLQALGLSLLNYKGSKACGFVFYNNYINKITSVL